MTTDRETARAALVDSIARAKAALIDMGAHPHGPLDGLYESSRAYLAATAQPEPPPDRRAWRERAGAALNSVVDAAYEKMEGCRDSIQPEGDKALAILDEPLRWPGDDGAGLLRQLFLRLNKMAVVPSVVKEGESVVPLRWVSSEIDRLLQAQAPPAAASSTHQFLATNGLPSSHCVRCGVNYREQYLSCSPPPAGIFDSRCPYMATAGMLCSKCGRMHDGKPVNTFLPPAAPTALPRRKPRFVFTDFNGNEHDDDVPPAANEPAPEPKHDRTLDYITSEMVKAQAERDAMRAECERLREERSRMRKERADMLRQINARHEDGCSLCGYDQKSYDEFADVSSENDALRAQLAAAEREKHAHAAKCVMEAQGLAMELMHDSHVVYRRIQPIIDREEAAAKVQP